MSGGIGYRIDDLIVLIQFEEQRVALVHEDQTIVIDTDLLGNIVDCVLMHMSDEGKLIPKEQLYVQ